MLSMFDRRAWMPAVRIAGACLSLCLIGCAPILNWFAPSTDAPALHEDGKPAPTRDVITLDIAIAKRPMRDPLLGLLWDDVDEIGVLDGQQRDVLNRSGFRIGVAGTIPSALQTILRESTEEEAQIDNPTWKNGTGTLPGSSSVTLFDGQDALFRVSPATARVLISSRANPSANDAGESQTEYENAQCVFRVTAHKIQDGWIKLRVLPEIHHGQRVNRAVITDDGPQYRESQKVEVMYDYQFDVTLNPGEAAVIGSTADSTSGTPGHGFFDTDHDGSRSAMTRLITVRFSSMQTVTGSRSE